jgi:hypothetical protein
MPLHPVRALAGAVEALRQEERASAGGVAVRQQEVVIGRRYFAKVGGDLVIVRITARTPFKRGRLAVFEAENLKTGRRLRLTAARLLAPWREPEVEFEEL